MDVKVKNPDSARPLRNIARFFRCSLIETIKKSYENNKVIVPGDMELHLVTCIM